jgi:HAE1 family hydrophobic/amphiphilic exporter-1
VKTPALYSFSTDDMPVLRIAVHGKVAPTKLYQTVKDHIKPMLSKLNGVGQVSIIGGEEREIKINIDRGKLASYKLSISQVYAAVGNSNLEYATGKVEGTQSQYTIRFAGKVTSLDQLRNIIISKGNNGSTIRLSDVAEVVDGVTEYSTLSKINGESSIGLMIQKQSDANAVAVCDLVKNEIANIEQQYSALGIKFEIASDQSIFTLASANAVMEDLMLAIILVAIVMFLFLHSLRNSFIVLVSIPTSLVSVFTAMYIFNFSLNLMTLMALSLVIGILVDDSIVVLENIHRHLHMGKDKRTAALDGKKRNRFYCRCYYNGRRCSVRADGSYFRYDWKHSKGICFGGCVFDIDEFVCFVYNYTSSCIAFQQNRTPYKGNADG